MVLYGNYSNRSRSASQREQVSNGFIGKPIDYWMFLYTGSYCVFVTTFRFSGYTSLLQSCLFGEKKAQLPQDSTGSESLDSYIIQICQCDYCSTITFMHVVTVYLSYNAYIFIGPVPNFSFQQLLITF